jgi:aryl-alcohol dehydrogenase-like predicted oxidoreductase
MRYARLGNSGLVVSKLAFGAMTIGKSWQGPLAAFDGGETANLVTEALDSGINFFDTADVYHNGESEELLGKALGQRRAEAVIATKVGMRVAPDLTSTGLSAIHINRSLDASLKRLGTDHIDVYICHRSDPLTPLEETLAALDAAVRSGKVRYLGFSNWPAWLAAKAIAIQQANGLAPFVTGQMYYSLLARDLETDYVPMALDAGVGTMVWSPLSSGFLSGKYTRDDPEGANGRLNQMDILPFDRERGYAIVDVVREIALARRVTAAAVSLAWVLERPTVATAIIGFTRREQFKDNLAAADLVLTAEETAALDAASDQSLPYPHNFLSRFKGDALATALA